MRGRMQFLALAAMLFVVGSCTKSCGTSRKDLTPEQVVEAYLDVSLNMIDVEDRDKLLSLTTGNLKNAITQATDDTLRQAFIERHYKLDNYSVVERRDRTPRETEITFSLTYRDLGKDRTSNANPEESPKVTTENTVSVVRENKIWLIRDVIGKKTTIDFPVLPNDVIKPGGGQEEPPMAESESETTPG